MCSTCVCQMLRSFGSLRPTYFEHKFFLACYILTHLPSWYSRLKNITKSANIMNSLRALLLFILDPNIFRGTLYLETSHRCCKNVIFIYVPRFSYGISSSVGRGAVGIVTCYGLGGPGTESPWGRDFSHLSIPPPPPPPLHRPIQWVPGLSRV